MKPRASEDAAEESGGSGEGASPPPGGALATATRTRSALTKQSGTWSLGHSAAVLRATERMTACNGLSLGAVGAAVVGSVSSLSPGCGRLPAGL